MVSLARKFTYNRPLDNLDNRRALYKRKPCNLFTFGLALISYLIFNSLAQADAPPLPINVYWQQVEKTKALIVNLETLSASERHAQLVPIADEWAQITSITVTDGTTIPINHSFLVARLRAEPPNLNELEALLTTLLDARERWPEARHSDSDIKPLETILAQAEFQWQADDQPSPLALLWQRLLGYFWDFISRFLPEEAVITADNALIRYLFTTLGSLILILALAFIFRELLLNLVDESELTADLETDLEILTADTALNRAQTLSAGGDYRTAVRYLYLSSLLLLDERGLLRYERSQTNREYLRSIAHLPTLAAILHDVIEVFDQVWYGYQSLDQASYAQYAARVAELRQQR